MEVLEKISAFLDLGDGYGDGYGNGNGDGYGNGKGKGYGYGSGTGSGTGNGYGDGYGSGNGNGHGNGYGYGCGYGCGNGHGNGNGNGYGYGNGYGNGDGDGNGYGCGYGCGDSNGNGYGYGTGYGVAELNGKKVYEVDNVPTILESVKGNIACGYTLRNNVELVPCYVAKIGNYFAHGSTSHEALLSAREKYEENMPLSERIAGTIKKYPTLDTKVPHSELYTLHHKLTGSCKFGRDEFVRSHGLDPKNGEMTMGEFINLTSNSYGKEAILKLKKAYENK